MKIAIFSIPQLPPGKHNIKDPRLDEINKLTGSKKKTYVQIELIDEAQAIDAHAVLVSKDSRTDIILKDLEFVETRLSRCEQESEKSLLLKLKDILEKEGFIFEAELSEEEKKLISGYGLLTNKPVVAVDETRLVNLDLLLAEALIQSGFISFFTAGEREARAWLIRKGTTAWEAAGSVHSDIQRGFIRAEIIGCDDFIQSRGETQAKQSGKLRLEQKEYVMQDGDVVNFRFNK